MFSNRMSSGVSVYKSISVETGTHTLDQHQIVNLLFEGILESLNTARGALAIKDIPAKCAAISRCIRILEEGLATGLDTVEGGELAHNLGGLYDYALHRLILANARNDDSMLQEVQRLIEPLSQSWKAIKGPSMFDGAPAKPAARLALVGA